MTTSTELSVPNMPRFPTAESNKTPARKHTARSRLMFNGATLSRRQPKKEQKPKQELEHELNRGKLSFQKKKKRTQTMYNQKYKIQLNREGFTKNSPEREK